MTFSEIPEVPEEQIITYSHPYNLPQYSLEGFTFNKDDFSKEDNYEKSLKDLADLREKLYKIHDLIRLEKLSQYYEQYINFCKDKKQIQDKLNQICESSKASVKHLSNYASKLYSFFTNKDDSKLSSDLISKFGDNFPDPNFNFKDGYLEVLKRFPINS